MPFPTNSIQYGIFKAPKLKGCDAKQLYKLDACLSECLLDAFEEPVTVEKMLIVSVSLFFSAYYSLTVVTGLEAPVDFLKYHWLIQTKRKTISPDLPQVTHAIREAFDTTRPLLQSIRNQIYGANSDVSALPVWLEKWKFVCTQEFQNRINRNIPAFQAFWEVGNVIALRLGHDDKFRRLIEFVVEATLNETKKSDPFIEN
jgi:hypothetical protein